jgi:hypothetical protein
MTGFADRVLAAMVCHTLDGAGRAYATVDLREIVHKRLPHPAAMPVLVLAARRLGNYHGYRREALEEALRAYREAGGAVLWIGGRERPLASSGLAPSFAEAEPGPWPVPTEKLPGSGLFLAGDASREVGDWAFLRTPYTPAGWQRPYGPLHLPETVVSDEQIEVLLELRDGDNRYRVGAIERLANAPGLGPLAWLPTYALHPWLFAEPVAVEPASLLRLDEVGTRIFLTALDRLRP